MPSSPSNPTRASAPTELTGSIERHPVQPARPGRGGLSCLDARENERHLTDAERFENVLGSIRGKRLTWDLLTAQEAG